MKKITLKDLHEINNKYPEKRDIHQAYQYDAKKGEWVFKGYTCSKCGRMFKRAGFIESHESSCKPPQKLANQNEIEAKIITVEGKVWAPIDINQNQTFGKTK